MISMDTIRELKYCPFYNDECREEWCMFWDEEQETCLLRDLARGLFYYIKVKLARGE